MTYQDVIEEFPKKINQCIDEGSDSRQDIPICIQDLHGVVWVRDDAVKLLIKRIEDLEKTNFLHKKLRN